MTILTAGACACIINYPETAKPAVAGTAAGTLMTGVKLFLQADTVKMALTTAVGTGSTSGAIAGAVVTKTTASAVTGAAVGGMCAGGVGSMMAGGMAVATGSIASSSLGLLTVGTSSNAAGIHATYDCWKPVVHDISEEPSNGMLLKDLVCHPHVGNVTINTSTSLPHIVIENVWNEKFEINYVILKDSDKMFCHANLISE